MNDIVSIFTGLMFGMGGAMMIFMSLIAFADNDTKRLGMVLLIGGVFALIFGFLLPIWTGAVA